MPDTTLRFRTASRSQAIELGSRLTRLGLTTDVKNDPRAVNTERAIMVVATGPVEVDVDSLLAEFSLVKMEQ